MARMAQTGPGHSPDGPGRCHRERVNVGANPRVHARLCLCHLCHLWLTRLRGEHDLPRQRSKRECPPGPGIRPARTAARGADNLVRPCTDGCTQRPADRNVRAPIRGGCQRPAQGPAAPRQGMHTTNRVSDARPDAVDVDPGGAAMAPGARTFLSAFAPVGVPSGWMDRCAAADTAPESQLCHDSLGFSIRGWSSCISAQCDP